MNRSTTTIVVAAIAATALTAAHMARSERADYRDGVCVALTGTTRCDYTQMIACQDPEGTGPTTAYPCAWIPARDDPAQGSGPTRIIMDHPCPVIPWRLSAVCISVPQKGALTS